MALRAALRSFLALARALTRAAGPPALLRVAPPFAVLLLFAAVVFGGNGMRPRDLVALFEASAPVRAALLAAWLLLTAPAARALLETPSTFLLRAMPVPPWQFWIVHAAHLLALQSPWALVFAVGAGPLAALAQGIAAAAGAAFITAPPSRPIEIVAAFVLAVALLLGAPTPILAFIAAGAGALAVAAAWARAPERSARPGASWVVGRAGIALFLAHAAVLARRDAVTLLRGAAVAVVGAVILALAARNNALDVPAARDGIALAAGAIPLALATGGVGVKVLETERRLEWLLLSNGAGPGLRAVAAAAVTAAWGAAAGALYGVTAALLSGGDPVPRLRLALLGTALGASLGAGGAFIARRAERPTGIDGTSAVVGMTAAALATCLLAAWLDAAALAPVASIALALAASTPRLLARRERRSEHAARLPWSEA